ncbi:MAG: molybdopterin molybdenumtransferase MoeA [Alphaproteobacteria bacterium]|nr:molybdopterin molybdenumtransferase MoeA [Alphaproteobacteria bacterium]
MAQLSDDCFAFGEALTPLDEALNALHERTEPIADMCDVPVSGAVGRILAEDIAATFNVPPHDNSAVDGYAVYYDDLDPKIETRLPVTGRAAAGHPLGRSTQRGEVIRIFTGAPMPMGDAGPDTVMMQEDCRVDGDHVVIAPGIKRGANRRTAGEDIRENEIVLHAGQVLRPQDIGVAASLGRTRLRVFEPLRVAVFSSGDELREPGNTLDPGAIFDANRFALAAALSQLGCAVTDLGIIRDDETVIRTALAEAAATHDLLVTSGGMSTGEEDHIKATVEALGSLHFWRLAIKPGRPVALGQIDTPRGPIPFAGLPGNPVAAIVTFLVIARPLILRLSGATDVAPISYRVRAGFDHRKKISRREFVRAKIVADTDGWPKAEKHGRSGAGVLSSLVGADGLVELPEDMTFLKAGSMVDFLPFTEVMP